MQFLAALLFWLIFPLLLIPAVVLLSLPYVLIASFFDQENYFKSIWLQLQRIAAKTHEIGCGVAGGAFL